VEQDSWIFPLQKSNDKSWRFVDNVADEEGQKDDDQEVEEEKPHDAAKRRWRVSR